MIERNEKRVTSSNCWLSLSHSTGHQWLKSNLGISPKSAWTVDPFGHGPVAPYLLRASGLRNTVVQRIHYGIKHVFFVFLNGFLINC